MKQKLKQHLKENGITAYRFAKDNGFSAQTVGHWLNGKCEPQLKNYHKLNQILCNKIQ